MEGLDQVSCPKCGEKMEQGFIFVPRGDLTWTKDGKDRIFPNFTDAEYLFEDPMFKIKKHSAFRCRKCGIVTFEHDKEQEKQLPT